MKKPEKKDKFKDCNGGEDCICCEYNGYNQACDDWEKWLSSLKLKRNCAMGLENQALQGDKE